ncbi:MAG: hypothetical protein JST16_07945 [Bdellovibrionales bacterium]|nr:hypothetical protein [Bdellovibrionales bacterium]
MKWRQLEEILPGITLPKGHTIHKLLPEDVSWFTTALRDWYPDIQVGTESRFLNPDFYREQIFVGPNQDSDAGRFFPVICRVDGEVAAWLVLYKDDDALTISSPMAGVVPEFRKEGVGLIFSRLLEAMGRAIGAELATVVTTLKMKGTQRILEEQGFQIVGILPAVDRDLVAPGKVRRVYEAVYSKLLVSSDNVLVPDRDCMTPRTQALFQFLFANQTKVAERSIEKPEEKYEAPSRSTFEIRAIGGH